MPHKSNDGSRFECVRQCQYRGRVWEPGELLIGSSRDIVPDHFRPLKSDEQTPTKILENPINIIKGWNTLGFRHFKEFLVSNKESWKTTSPQAKFAALKKWVSVAPAKERQDFPLQLSDNDEIDFEEMLNPKKAKETVKEIDDAPPPDSTPISTGKGKAKE